MRGLRWFLAVACLVVGSAFAATYTAIAAGGNWSANATWGGGGHPVAGDTANIDATMTGTVTVDAAAACAVLNCTGNGGTLAFGNFTVTVTGGVTLGGTITAGTGGLKLTGAQTITSGGITFPGTLELAVAGNVTLSGNWVNTGLVTFSAATAIKKTTAETLTANGGLTNSVTAGNGDATIILGGGTWSGGTSLYVYHNVTLAGNVTVGTIAFGNSKTLTYSSGTITTTGSFLQIGSAATLNTAGVTWNIVSIGNATITLGSALSVTDLRCLNATFSGAYNISAGTLRKTTTGANASYGITFVSGQTVTVTTALDLLGGSLYWADSGAATAFVQSSTPGAATNLVYQGTKANCTVAGMIFTDVSFSGTQVAELINWCGGTLTRTTKIRNVDQSKLPQGYLGGF